MRDTKERTCSKFSVQIYKLRWSDDAQSGKLKWLIDIGKVKGVDWCAGEEFNGRIRFSPIFSPLKDEELKDKLSVMLMRWGWTIDVYSLAVEEMN